MNDLEKEIIKVILTYLIFPLKKIENNNLLSVKNNIKGNKISEFENISEDRKILLNI